MVANTIWATVKKSGYLLLSHLVTLIITRNQDVSVERETVVDEGGREPDVHLDQCFFQHVRVLEEVKR